MSLPDSEILTVKEVAKYLRLPTSTAYEMVRQGVIPSVKLGRQIRVPRKWLLELLESRKTPAAGRIDYPLSRPAKEGQISNEREHRRVNQKREVSREGGYRS